MVRKCPVCGADIVDDAVYCSSCGIQMSVPRPAPAMAPIRPAMLEVPGSVPLFRGPPPNIALPHPMMMPLLPPPRPLWSILVTIAAGILVIVGVIAAFVYPPSEQLVLYLLQILLPTAAVADLMAVATVIGVALAFTLFLAAFLMQQGYGVFGGIIGFVAAVVSITIGGGFLAGFALGIIGAFLAVMRK